FSHPLLKDHKIQVAGIEYFDVIYGTQAKINVYNPMVKNNSKDLSASWIQISKVQKVGVADGIGAGSWVYPSYSGNNFARFHVAWLDGLKTCPDHDCGAFVQVSSSVGLGGRFKPVSVYNGPQYVIDVVIFKDPKTKNWWVAYGPQNIHIGYWPREIFHFMKDQCNYALWGGYVQGPTASSHSPQMGSGHFASEGFGKAAFVSNIQIVDNEGKYVSPNDKQIGLVATNLSKYTAKAHGYGYSHYGVHT
uniref:Neprosin PEP catalytic domain-containing protein n=1 Tax=Aegilops tauschii subsp. strangulata TaxID=200361 RepID=A0A453KBG8_AEGTS